MSPPNWDDDFDFDDIDEPANKKKPAQKKKNNQYDDDDFFDEPKSKLPTIQNNNSSSKNLPPKRASSKYNPYAENMNLNANSYEDLYEEQPLENISKQKPKKASALKLPDQEEDFYQDIDDIPMNNQSIKKLQSQKEQKNDNNNDDVADEYQQEFDDDYGEDFEQVELQEPKKQPEPVIKTQQPKKKSILNVAPANKKQPPKPPSRPRQITQPPKRNLTSLKPQKQQGMVRQNSQKSIRSVNSARQRATSKSRPPLGNKLSTNNSFVPQKYTNQISKAFPQQSVDNLKALPPQKITKMNDRVRAMIKRFNQQLNNLISKNMIHLKAKKNEKTVTVQDRLRVYEQQKKNNETMIEYMERQFDKLCGRQGQLREQQYQLMTQKKIQQTKQLIKQTQKNITKLKYQVKNQGNKLSKKGQDKKMAQQLHHLKTVLIQSKKDEQKHQQKIQKQEEQAVQLESKIADIEYKISQVVDKARQKGIQLENREDLVRKYQQIKKKVQISRNHRGKLQNLLKTKSQMIGHEKQQLRIKIKNSEMEIKNLYQSINHSHAQSCKIVQKAKNNPRVNSNLATHLEQILQSLQQTQQIDSFSVRSESNKSQASQRPPKNHNIPAINNQLKEHHRTQAIERTQQQNSKPSLMKKKPKINEFPIQQKKDDGGRIWKDDEKKHQQPKQQPIKKIDEQADKKKPFSLKRRQGSAQYKPNNQIKVQNKNDEGGLKLDIPDNNAPVKQQQQKKQEVPSLAGPRMMKFKRKLNNNNDDSKANTSKQLPTQNQPQKQPIIPTNNNNTLITAVQPQKKQQQQKPFVPKRFNLRNRQQQQQKKQDAYTPSIQTNKKIQNKYEQTSKKQQPIKQKNQMKFNFNEVEDPYANKNNNNNNDNQVKIENKNDDNKIKIPSLEKQEAQSKPKFSLRLRDRKKKQENNDDTGGYMPTNSQKAVNIELTDNKPKQESATNPYAPTIQKQKPKQQPISNPYNPYAQQQTNINVPSRRRQGPIKKSKPQINAPKQKINIYEQAEQAQGLNQFVNQSPKKKNDLYEPSYGALDINNKPQKQPDLNDLLGLNNNKKKNDDDLADLLGGGTATKKNTKKKNQFFGDMDF